MADAWHSETEPDFERWYRKLGGYEQAVTSAAIQNVLHVYGIDICEMEWGKALGQGLYEFRIRQSLHAIKTWGEPSPGPAAPGEDRTVLLRIFVTFHGDKVVLLFSGYDKGRDPSERRQDREIKKARKLLKAWKARKGD